MNRTEEKINYIRDNIPRRKSILIRTAFLSWIVVIFTVGIFIISIIPLLMTHLKDEMAVRARFAGSSIAQVTVSTILVEDYSTVVDHCMTVVKENPSILYAVITRHDGFSLVHTRGKWSLEHLDGVWNPAPEKAFHNGQFIQSDLVNREAFHMSFPFSCSGIDWGWIHIGLSPDKFYVDLKALYIRTLLIALLSIFVGLISSYFFARRLSRPILLLDRHTQKVGSGDLSAQVEISTGDELESLADSFNSMTKYLKKSQDELKSTHKKLAHAEKMEAIGTLAGGVAHDLNNVLSGIVTFPELLLINLPEDDPLRKPILTIKESGERAAAIVQDLLTLARRGVTNTDVLDLNNIISNYLKSPEHEKTMSFYPEIDITISLESDLNICGSSIHLTKIIMNLISNAVESIPGEGTIVINTRNQYVDRPIKDYDNVYEGDYVVMEVRDSGTGIAPSDIKRIFDPFYTKKVMGRSGTGLGMSVVWGAVKDHKGYINVESRVDNGTTIEIYLPATEEKPEDKKENIPLESYLGHGEKILVVDDIENQRHIASDILDILNYSVETVSSGEDAVVYMTKNDVDLILLDMVMDPGMDGLDTYKEIRKIHPGQKVVIVTGYAKNKRVQKVRALGAGKYIKKPYTIETVGMAISHELSK